MADSRPDSLGARPERHDAEGIRGLSRVQAGASARLTAFGPQLAWVVAALPAAIAAWYIHTYGVNGASWDHLTNGELFERYYGGSLTVGYFLTPYLEHLKLIPRLICLGLGLPTGFNNVVEMYFQWLVLCATAGVLYWAFAQRLGSNGAGLALRLAPVFFVLFSVGQYEAMLVGDGMITYMGACSTVVALSLLATGRTRPTFYAGVAGIVGSLSHATGFLAWPIGIVTISLSRELGAPASSDHVSRRLAVWVAASAVAVGIYAANWPVMATPHMAFSLSHPWEAARFAVQAGGVFFGQAAGPQLWGGVIALVVQGVIVTAAVKHAARDRRLPIGVSFILFALAVQVLISAGRAEAGTVAGRYSVFLGFGLAGAYLTALEMASRVPSRMYRVMWVLTTALIAAGSVFSYRDGFATGPAVRDARLRSVQVLRTYHVQDDETIARLLYPWPDLGRMFAVHLERWNLNVFAEPVPDLSQLPLTQPPAIAIDLLNHAPLTGAVTVSANDTLSFSGWAYDAAAKTPFTSAFVHLEPGNLDLPAAYGLSRPDVGRLFAVAGTVGFEAVYSAGMLPAGEHRMSLVFVTQDPPRRSVTPAVVRIIRR